MNIDLTHIALQITSKQVDALKLRLAHTQDELDARRAQITRLTEELRVSRLQTTTARAVQARHATEGSFLALCVVLLLVS